MTSLIKRPIEICISHFSLNMKENMARMKLAYAGDKDDDNDDVEPVAEIQSKKKLKKS